MEISAGVAAQAKSPAGVLPEPPPELGARRVLTDRYCAFLTAMPTVTFVEDLRFPVAEAAEVVQEVRALLRSAGRAQAAWVVSFTAPELQSALAGLGMSPYTDPPLGELSTAMALTARPDWPPSPDVTVREAVELEDFVAAADLAVSHFGMSDADAEAIHRTQHARHALLQQGHVHMRTFLAYLHGDLVGLGHGVDGPFGTNLSGSSVSPQARGRGVYRALVAVRWEHAVARGIPALTIQAGAMSQPILDRLRFVTVDRQHVLCDRFD